MNSLKRLGTAVLLVSLGVLFGASPAFAQKYTYALVPPAIDPPEPEASGKVTVARSWDRKSQLLTDEVTVSCSGLTPVNQYHVVYFVMQYVYGDGGTGESSWYVEQPVATDKSGRLTTQVSYLPVYGGTSTNISVAWVENDEGTIVLEREP